MNKNTAGIWPLFFSLMIRTAILLFILLVFLKPAMKCLYPVKYTDIIYKYSTKYELSPHLVMAVISKESKFNPDAVSHKGAKGLMQLKDATADWCIDSFDISRYGMDIFEPELNINVGCAYISYLFDRFDGRKNAALAAYNGGEGNVSIWLGDSGGDLAISRIPFKETAVYVETVLNREKVYNFLY